MTEREEVYKAIDTERTYQSKLGPDRTGVQQDMDKTQAEYIFMMEEYIQRARSEWMKNPGNTQGTVEAAQHEIRKVAGIAVQCMEKYGAPHRKL